MSWTGAGTGDHMARSPRGPAWLGTRTSKEKGLRGANLVLGVLAVAVRTVRSQKLTLSCLVLPLDKRSTCRKVPEWLIQGSVTSTGHQPPSGAFPVPVLPVPVPPTRSQAGCGGAGRPSPGRRCPPREQLLWGDPGTGGSLLPSFLFWALPPSSQAAPPPRCGAVDRHASQWPHLHFLRPQRSLQGLAESREQWSPKTAALDIFLPFSRPKDPSPWVTAGSTST